MYRTKPRTILIAVYWAYLLSLLLGSLPIAAVANPAEPQASGLPRRTKSGGPLFAPPNIERTRRGLDLKWGCTKPLLPPASQIGLTTAEYPTFFVSVPKTSEQKVEFVLLDEKGEVYNTSFTIAGEAGILSISLPATAGIPPLLIGKDYQWYLSIDCDIEWRDVVAAGGWIRRVKPSSTLAEQLQQATGRDRVLAYAANGIWYDAVATLAELRHANPDDRTLASDWTSLLTQVGLEHVAERKLIEP